MKSQALKSKTLKSTVLQSMGAIAAVTFMLGGCSNHQAYDSLQGARQNECNQIVDNNARLRCFDDANKNYESYRKERDAALTK